MAYLGNNLTVQQYAPTISYLSGNGSTTVFTLPIAVVSAAQIIVSVANVVQNPSSAFSVSGTTLTFTSAPPSGTNNIWVEYTSLQTNTIAPSAGTVGPTQINPAYSLWNLSGGNINYTAGNVGIGTSSPVGKLQIDSNAGSTVTNTLTLNNNGGGAGNGAAVNFYNNTALQPFTGRINSLDDGNYGFHMVFSTKPGGGSGSGALTERMRINSNGAITTSYNPAFFSIITGGTYTGGNTFGGSLTGTNPSTRSSYYSNGTFTAPVSGYYSFNFQIYDFNNTNTTYAVFKNGAGYVPSDWFQMVNPGNAMLTWSFTIYLATNDYVQMGLRTGTGGTVNLYSGHSYWAGFLVG
jgi:C1q domain